MRFVTLRCVFSLMVLSATPAIAETATLRAVAASTDSFQLTAANRSVDRSFLVDRTSLLSISLVAASRTLTVSMTSPTGERFVIGTTATPSFQSGIAPLGSGATSGAGYLATFSNPIPGTWRLSVTETAMPANGLGVLVTENFNNQTTMVLIGGSDSVPIGSNARIALVVFDGPQKVRNAAITARLANPADAAAAPVTITFRDDGMAADEIAGDGIYEAFATAGREGKYFVQAEATGNASTGPFRRTGAAELRFVRRNAQIRGFEDRGVDDDFDGEYEQIDVTLDATVAESGNYVISVKLAAANGKELVRSIQKTFTAGSADAEIEFSAEEIRSQLAVNGPYEIAEARYARVVNGEPVPADVRYDLGTTSAYSLSDLQHPTLRLSEDGAAAGIDLDGNQLFDRLEIQIGLIADYAGRYDASVSLTDVNGHEIAFASGTVDLESGLNTIVITFDGSVIGQNGVNGPYVLSNLIVFGEQQSLIATRAFTTQFFAARQFEGYVSKPRHRGVRH